MLHFGMNMPYYLMMLYGSMMIVMVLILRMLFRNRLPKFVFPVLWCVVLLRFVIPFSVSSPLSLPMPGNVLSPIQVSYSSRVAVADAIYSSEATVGTGNISSWDITAVAEGPVVNYEAGEWHGQTVGYDNVSIAYDPVEERISVKGYSDSVTEAYGGISQEAYSGYDPSQGSVLDRILSYFDLFYKDIFMARRLLLIIYILSFTVAAGIL